jgi:hypothetical protein
VPAAFAPCRKQYSASIPSFRRRDARLLKCRQAAGGKKTFLKKTAASATLCAELEKKNKEVTAENPIKRVGVIF